MTKGLLVKQFVAGRCLSYILSSGGRALTIDPHISLLAEYSNYLKRNHLRLDYILDTHTHADHFSLAAVLKKKFKAVVLMHEKAVSSVATRRLNDNDKVPLGTADLDVIYTPGHTDDSISIYTEGMLFTGDVLLIGSVGRTDFQNGSSEDMFNTLQKLKNLPGETTIFPSHYYHQKQSAVLSEEIKENPFLKEADRKVFVVNMQFKRTPKPFNIENIIRVNQTGQAVSLAIIPPREAHALLTADPQARLLDVRSIAEFNQVHIEKSIHIPIESLASRVNELNQPGAIYVVFCHTGNRSVMAADIMMQAGINSAKVMECGIAGWQKEGLPVVKGQGGMSIERQVRTAAGGLILFGLIMAWLVHTSFIAIPAFVSCGLIFSGLTDNCLMASVLMKLPFNKKMYQAPPNGGTCAVSL